MSHCVTLFPPGRLLAASLSNEQAMKAILKEEKKVRKKEEGGGGRSRPNYGTKVALESSASRYVVAAL